MRKQDIRVGETYKTVNDWQFGGAKVTVVEGPTVQPGWAHGSAGRIGWVARLEHATRMVDAGTLRWVPSRTLQRPWTVEDDEREQRRQERINEANGVRARLQELGYGDLQWQPDGRLLTLNVRASHRVLDALRDYWEQHGGYPTGPSGGRRV